jgi:hypothetical protein
MRLAVIGSVLDSSVACVACGSGGDLAGGVGGESRKQEAGSRKQNAGSRKQETGSRKQEAVNGP